LTREVRQALELFLMRSALGRPFVAPPGLPLERASTLRRAFEQTMADPAFVQEAARNNLTVEPLSGEELAAIIGRAYLMPPEIIRRTREVLGRAVDHKAK